MGPMIDDEVTPVFLINGFLEAGKTEFLSFTMEQVSLNYGNADEAPLSHMSVEEAEKYAEEGQFGTSSMLPKIDAALSFLKAGKNRSAIITTMAKAEDAVNGKAGTTIE